MERIDDEREKSEERWIKERTIYEFVIYLYDQTGAKMFKARLFVIVSSNVNGDVRAKR